MIEFKNISVVYNENTDGEKLAIDGLSFTVNRGQWCNLLGPNGSGKSTLLRLLMGEIKPSAGDILIDGVSILNRKAFARARYFFFIEQDTRANLVPSMTIEENLLLAVCGSRFPVFHFVKQKKRRELVMAALQKIDMGLENRLDTQVRFLSGGEKQALVIAMALIMRAPILLLDEFLAAMDPQAGPQLLQVIRKLSHLENLTVLSVTHNLEHIYHDTQGDDRILLLQNGTLHRSEYTKNTSREWLFDQYNGSSLSTL